MTLDATNLVSEPLTDCGHSGREAASTPEATVVAPAPAILEQLAEDVLKLNRPDA